ncbi:MAG TPA: hypothetical protein VF756_22290 [Thermoanaerobaculia bacterium]
MTPPNIPPGIDPELVSEIFAVPGTWGVFQVCLRKFPSPSQAAAFLGYAFAIAYQRGLPLEARLTAGSDVVLVTHGVLQPGPDGKLTCPSLDFASDLG